MKLEVTEADRARASKLIAELDAAGKLADPRAALHTTICQSLAMVRAVVRKRVAKGNKLTLPDGSVVRVEKSGASLAIYLTERGQMERQLLSYGRTEERAA